MWVAAAGSYLWAGHLPITGFLICPQIEDETQVSRATQGEQDNYEMHVRAANIVSHQVEGPARAPAPWGSHWGFLGGGQATSQETPLKRRAVHGSV